jgi:hypothetical protein
METLMKNLQLESRFDLKDTTPRSLFSASVRHRVFAILLVLAIAAVTIALTGKHSSVGGNLILAPGQPGLEPALY